MPEFIDQLRNEANETLTENGGAAYLSTGSHCLDLFASIGALRSADEDEIDRRFTRAFAEDRDAAVKLLFFARDVRGGLGERRVFRTILRRLAETHPHSVDKNVPFIAEYGRWDDVLTLFGTPCEQTALEVIRLQLEQDLAALKNGGGVSLLAKWLPSVNASSPDTIRTAKRLARALGMKDAEYRHMLTSLRARLDLLENDLRERDYTFDYARQPSCAMLKYRKAFLRNDGERYIAFLDSVQKGEAMLHAENVAPYEIVTPFLTKLMYGKKTDEEEALNATWASLPDFGGDENTLAIIDTSGSMYGGTPLPAAVAFSLGLYFAERNKGTFANRFIEFSAHPQLIELKGETFAERLRFAASFSEVANTDLEAVFELILRTAVNGGIPQEELPAKLVIISDMEFDMCVDNASAHLFEQEKTRFAERGYKLPDVVFWNVASRNRQQPVTVNEQGVALVSGVTPRIFTMIAGGIVDPYVFMREILSSERYARISA